VAKDVEKGQGKTRRKLIIKTCHLKSERKPGVKKAMK